MSDRRRVLIVSPEYPYPPIDGQKVRVYNLFRQFPEGYSFDFLTFGESDNINNEIFQARLGNFFESVEFISRSTLQKVSLQGTFASFRNILWPDVMSGGEPFFSPILAARVKEKVATGKYDLVYLCGLYISLYFDKKAETVPYVVDITDSYSLLTRSYIRQEHRPLAKLKKFLDYVWADRYEKIHASKIRNIIMISAVDAERIGRNCPDSKIWVVQNGVDTEYFRSRAVDRPASSLLFTGVMSYPPNNEAMLRFIRDVYPRVRTRMPDVSLTVAGRNPTEELKELAMQTPGVTVTGFVDDLRRYFDGATVYVSPLLSGAGMKNKILEAWSMGLPVVASDVSCSGIEARDRDNILIANSPDQFSCAIIALLSDRQLRKSISASGRLTVEKSYSWRSHSSYLAGIFEDILQNAARSKR